MEWQQFLAIVLGAIVSGIIGIFTVLLTGKMRDKQWKRENIIKPLYNEIDRIRISQAHQIDGRFRSFWNQLDSYSKLRVGEKLRNGFAGYTDLIDRFQSALKRYDEMRRKTIPAFEGRVRRAMANYLTDDGNQILLEKYEGGSSSIDIGKWLERFLEVLTSNKDEHGLAEALITKSESSHWGYERFFRVWRSQQPAVFADLAHEFRDAKMPQEYNDALEEVQRLRQKLVSTTESLGNQLLEQSKKHW